MFRCGAHFILYERLHLQKINNFFGRALCVAHSFAYAAHLWFLRAVLIRTQSAIVASWRATDLATHPSERLSHPSLRSKFQVFFVLAILHKYVSRCTAQLL
jgi:hypothetical protein